MDFTSKQTGEKFYITVNRATTDQLDQAIKDLEERGFSLVKRGVTNGETVCYSSTNKRNAKYEFQGTERYSKAWARLVKTQ